MFSRLLAVAAPFLLLLPSSIQAQPARAPTVTPELLRRHIEVLASDAYEGRKPGTPGENKTLLYIASQFARLGLEPATGKGSWYQPVPLVQRRPFAHRALFSARGTNAELRDEDLILVGREAMVQVRDAPVYFAGHGASVPAGSRLNGAIVLMLYSGGKGVPGFGERSRAAVAAGAEAVIAVFGEDTSWGVIRSAYAEGGDRLQSESIARIQGALPHAAAARLIEASGTSLESLRTAGGAPDFRPVRLDLRGTLEASTEVRDYISHNVVGRLRGTGKTGESVLYLGHWDHLGICRPEGAADRICNGAVDNASGIAMLIEVAAALGRGKRPERDILFMGTTAEEVGLLGAEYFGANPVAPLKSIVAAVNMDTVAIHEAGEPVAVIGRGTASLDRLIEESAAELGRKMDNDKEADEFVSRQDGWILTKAGIPTVMVGGSFSNMQRLGSFLSGNYHQPGDDLDPEPILGGAAEDTELMILLGRKLADPKRYQPPGR